MDEFFCYSCCKHKPIRLKVLDDRSPKDRCTTCRDTAMERAKRNRSVNTPDLKKKRAWHDRFMEERFSGDQ